MLSSTCQSIQSLPGHRPKPDYRYLNAAAIAKQTYATGRPILDVAEEETALSREELEASSIRPNWRMVALSNERVDVDNAEDSH